MSSQKTTNLNMHKWEPADAVQRTEFNDNFQKIDEHAQSVTSQLAQKVKADDLVVYLDDRFPRTTGETSDSPRIQRAIDYVQRYGENTDILSDGTNNTMLGGTIILPSGVLEITSSLIVNSIAIAGVGNPKRIAGVNIIGSGRTSTVLDATNLPNVSPLIVNGSHFYASDFQILNSQKHGIETNGVSLWDLGFERIFINKPANDGIHFNDVFKVHVSHCFVYGGGGYGLSFNKYHTSCLVENNYVLSCALGGYLVGKRGDPTFSGGMTYSTFASNACDGGIDAYTFVGCRGVEVNGCGCEVVSGHSIIISGLESNMAINGFVSDRVQGNGVFIEGNRSKILINNFTDSNPINLSTPLIAGGGVDAQVIVTNITNKRTYLYAANAILNVIFNDKKKSKTVQFDTQSKTIATLKHDSGYITNYSGLITITAINGGVINSNSTLNTCVYYLLVNKGTGGSNITLLGFAGLKGDTTSPTSHPSFNFTFVGDDLIATHTTSNAWASRAFSFVFDTSGEVYAQ